MGHKISGIHILQTIDYLAKKYDRKNLIKGIFISEAKSEIEIRQIEFLGQGSREWVEK